MSEPKNPAQEPDPEQPSAGRVDESRRNLIKKIAAIGLGHMALIQIGREARAAAPQHPTGGGPGAIPPADGGELDPPAPPACTQPDIDCGSPTPDGNAHYQDIDCTQPASTPQGYETDDSCGKTTGGPGGEVYADSSCGYMNQTTEQVETDEDCNQPGGLSGKWFDQDCNAGKLGGPVHQDNDCRATQSDQDCSNSAGGTEAHHDNDCSATVVESDDDCGLNQAAGKHKDSSCGDGSGSVSPDLDCTLSSPWDAPPHSDSDCNLPNPQGGNLLDGPDD